MKTIKIIVLMILLYNNSNAVELDLKPHIVNFNDLEVKGDTVIAYGSNGSYLISYDDTETWEQYMIFDRGRIINMYYTDSLWAMFNEFGEVAYSYNKGEKWSNRQLIELIGDDSIYNMINYEKGFFFRTKTKLAIADFDFQIKNEYLENSTTLFEGQRPLTYKFSFTPYKEKLISEMDSSKLLVFDFDLKPLDTIKLNELTGEHSQSSQYNLFIDSSYFYCQMNYNVYRSEDFKVFNRYYNTRQRRNTIYYKNIDNTVYGILFAHRNHPYFYELYKFVQDDSLELICKHQCKYLIDAVTNLRNIRIKNNKIYTVGDLKYVSSTSITDSLIYFKSRSLFPGIVKPPILLEDSSMISFTTNNQGTLYNTLYRSTNSGITFTPVNELGDDVIFEECFSMKNGLYDKENNELTYTAFSKSDYDSCYWAFISKDYGKTYKHYPINKSDISFSYYIYPNTPTTTNMIKLNHKYITFWNYKNKDKIYNTIGFYNSDFSLITKLNLYDNLLVWLLDAKDTNTFTFYNYNIDLKQSEVISTDNQGESWVTIKSYNINDSLLYFEEIKFKKKKFLFTFYYNLLDSIAKIDVLDIENKTIESICNWKSHKPYWFGSNANHRLHSAICEDNDTLYLAVEDTVFYFTNIFNKENWEFFLLPNNGNIIRTFQKYGDKYWANYADDKVDRNLYWFTIKPEKPKEPAKILAENYDFETKDIKDTTITIQPIIVCNTSTESDLKIYGFSELSQESFTNEYVWNDTLAYISISPQNYIEIPISFKPIEPKKYLDSIIVYSNATELDSIIYLQGEGIDTTTSVIDNWIEKRNYLYFFPPYPIPSKEKVNSLVYYDKELDLKNDVKILDIFGNQLKIEDDLTIDYQTKYSGILTWNCSAVSDGIYFILLTRGTERLAIKVLVSK